MAIVPIALANVRFPTSPEDSLDIVLDAMTKAAKGGSTLICFPECILPGYRFDDSSAPPSQEWLDHAWKQVDIKAAELKLWVILGTERFAPEGLHITARVTNSKGILEGFQDKVQLDPSEDDIYVPGDKRRLFKMGELTFGIVICHEGWRYPETVRWAAMNGAQVVFHPHTEIPDSCDSLPSSFADPTNTFHEKAAICRANENTCYFATVNCAFPEGTTTTSALIDPEGNVVTYQKYGQHGILFCNIDTERATRLLANRFKPQSVNKNNT